MSVPKSRVFTVNKGFGLNATVDYTNHKAEQIVNINLPPVGTGSVENVNADYPPPPDLPIPPPIHSEQKLPESVEDFQKIIQEKDRALQAMILIIYIIRNNPVIFKEFVLPEKNMLAELVRLLTNADSVDIMTKTGDIDCTCCGGGNGDMVLIDKIFVRRDSDIGNLKYNYAYVTQTLDGFGISTKIATE
jgi:hypothetical protein